MATLTFNTIARHMRTLDICMMTTLSPRGVLNSRPMSNNGDVSYKGTSYFFTYEGSQKINDLTANKGVSLNFEGAGSLYITVTGKAKLIRTKAVIEEHWRDSLNQWFEQGVDTPGIVLIEVKGARLKYWQKNKEGAIKIPKR